MNDRVLSVNEFNSIVDNSLHEFFPSVQVEGEISKITFQASGHWYFSIKDESASLDCVLFKFNAIKQTFRPSVGDKVIVQGVPNIYPQTGRFQLKCSLIKRSGIGKLLEIIEQNKQKWTSTYFTRPKRELPLFIKTVAVITSTTGDVLHDIICNIGEGVNLKVIPATMQGDMCAKTVSDAIYRANALQDSGKLNADVLIVARGGGSFEDLYPFNDELIVKALSESKLICISAIGHDPDTPLCDLAADMRANTPTQAGAFIRERNDAFKKFIKDSKEYIASSIQRRIENAFQKNTFDRDKLKVCLEGRSKNQILDLKNQKANLKTMMLHYLNAKFNDGESKIKLIKAYSPYSILSRGYSIVKGDDGKVVKSVNKLKNGTKFTIKLNDGTVRAVSEGEQ